MKDYRKSHIPSWLESLTSVLLAVVLLALVIPVTFRRPEFLFLLGLGPVLAALYRITGRSRLRALERLADGGLLNQLTGSISPVRRRWKRILTISGILLVVIGLARPVWNEAPLDVKARGIDLMVALDTSLSMLAQDVPPSRFQRAKLEIRDLLWKLSGDRIGITVFSGDAYVACPLTLDYAAADLFLRDITTDSVVTRGTNLERAIRTAVQGLGDLESDRKKAILLVSDGEHLSPDDDPFTAAREAGEKGIRIHTVAIGDTRQETPIPIIEDGVQTGWREWQGRTVFTRPDMVMLSRIAQASGGKDFHATPEQAEIARILDVIREEERREFQAFLSTRKLEQFQWFLAGAVLLLGIASLLGDRKSTKEGRVRA